MEIFAMLFAILMIAAAIAATILIGSFVSGWLGALMFVALAFCIYRTATHQTGQSNSATLNAFQAPLSDD